jgi:hypothetical protein
MNIYEQLNAINPTEQPAVPTSVQEVREMRRQKKVSEQEYERFWAKNKHFLEEKYNAEMKNKNNVIWLWDLYVWNEDKPEAKAIIAKLQQFKRFIQGYRDPPLRCAVVDFREFPIPDAKDEAVVWDD